MSRAVELTDVRLSYSLEGQNLPVLRGISLHVEKGELLAICGPSGSGKSTFLYIMGCLLKPESGDVYINGIDVSRLSSGELAGLRNKTIGFVFQQFHLLPRTSVLDNILLPAHYPAEHAKISEADVEKAKRLAEELGLGDRLGHQPNQLSGGQQQRVAIARCLMRDPDVILADEPTGNLDSKSASQVIEQLKDLNRKGKTVIIITHAPEIARECDRVVYLRDGEIVQEETKATSNATMNAGTDAASNAARVPNVDANIGAKISTKVSTEGTRPVPNLPRRRALSGWLKYWPLTRVSFPLAVDNLRRNKMRSFLTMIGVTIGVAAVLAMITLGQFTKEKILDSYAELGVNTVAVRGYQNWNMKATDIVPVMFQSFSWEKDLLPLKRVFPEAIRLTPVMYDWNNSANHAGRRIENEIQLWGVGEDAFEVTRKRILAGRGFSAYHVLMKSPVCVIGYEVGERLFTQESPIGQILEINMDERSFGCRVLGVFGKQSSNSEWAKPNLQVWIPYTLYQSVSANPWSAQIRETMVELKPGSDIETTGQSIQAFFEKKYGASGRFSVDSDSKLIAQMRRFLSLFTLLLTMIALVCLGVGGMGITNMMLVSVTERLKEIGLRKALGATDLSIRVQFLTESVLLCAFAGVIGLVLGFFTYQSAIFLASKFIKQVSFEWVWDPFAIVIALSAILAVGVLAGLIPALKAERLQVIEALRSE